jgi:hypothetical protein
MNISIVFNNTGDVVSFSLTNPDIAVYYVEWLESINKNNFSFSSDSNQFDKLIMLLHASINDNNKIIRQLNSKPIETYNDLEYLNQDNLNRLHTAWVSWYHQTYDIKANQQSDNIEISTMADKILEKFPDNELTPPMYMVLAKLNLMDNYTNNINNYIHKFEESFRDLQFETNLLCQTDNIFSKSRLTNNLNNLRIKFKHLGRPLYNKFETFDDKLEHDDENSFDELVGYVEVNLIKPQTIPLSIEYIDWCTHRNKIPSGTHLNLGNLLDIDSKLTDYRQIFYRNIKNKNTFSLQIN